MTTINDNMTICPYQLMPAILECINIYKGAFADVVCNLTSVCAPFYYNIIIEYKINNRNVEISKSQNYVNKIGMVLTQRYLTFCDL